MRQSKPHQTQVGQVMPKMEVLNSMVPEQTAALQQMLVQLQAPDHDQPQLRQNLSSLCQGLMPGPPKQIALYLHEQNTASLCHAGLIEQRSRSAGWVTTPSVGVKRLNFWPYYNHSKVFWYITTSKEPISLSYSL